MVTVTSDTGTSAIFPLVPCCSLAQSMQENILIGCIIIGSVKPETIEWTTKDKSQVNEKRYDAAQISILAIPSQDWNNKHFTCSIKEDNTNKKFDLQRRCGKSYSDPIVETLISSCAAIDIVPLTCFVTNFRPNVTKLVWLRNGVAENNYVGFSPELDNAHIVMGKSIKNVSSESWNKEDIYTCQVTSHDKSIIRNISRCSACQSTSGDPVVILDQPTNEELFSNEGKITCTVFGSKLDIKEVYVKRNGIKVNTEDNKTQDDKHVKITYKITLEQWESTTELSCVATKYCTSTDTEKTIKIEKKKTEPKDFKIPSVSVSRLYHHEFQEGEWITLICKVTGFYPEEIGIKWENKNKGVSASSYTRSPVSCSEKSCSAFSLLKFSKKEEIGGYQCVIQHKSLKQPNRRISQKVTETQREPSVLVLQSSDSEEKKTLACIADGHFPKDIKIEWKLHDGSTLPSSTETDYKNNGTFRTICSIPVKKDYWAMGHTYKCEVTHKSIVKKIVKNINAFGLFASKTSHVSCVTNAINASIKWILDGKPRLQNDSKEQIIHNNRTWIKSTISIGFKEWNAASNFSCMLDVPKELPQSQLKTYKTQREPSVLVLQSPDSEERKTLVCIADGHFPKEIKVEWKVHNESLDSSYNETEYKSDGTYRTMCSIEVSKDDWAKGHTYTCEVSHKSISKNIVKTINALGLLVDKTAHISCVTNAINPSIKWILDGKPRSQNDSKEQIIHNNRTWFKSTVSIDLEGWNATSNFSCMLDLPQEPKLNVLRTYNTTQPTDTPFIYQDEGGEELSDTEDTSSVWTTSTTFITLFLITIVYSTFVTFIKVK
uniref:Ig-like domain-containing protein n=2 Tax=Xenopus tropicalis TaxID=8364 RepID=A0A803JIQ2_XENTR